MAAETNEEEFQFRAPQPVVRRFTRTSTTKIDNACAAADEIPPKESSMPQLERAKEKSQELASRSDSEHKSATKRKFEDESEYIDEPSAKRQKLSTIGKNDSNDNNQIIELNDKRDASKLSKSDIKCNTELDQAYKNVKLLINNKEKKARKEKKRLKKLHQTRKESENDSSNNVGNYDSLGSIEGANRMIKERGNDEMNEDGPTVAGFKAEDSNGNEMEYDGATIVNATEISNMEKHGKKKKKKKHKGTLKFKSKNKSESKDKSKGKGYNTMQEKTLESQLDERVKKKHDKFAWF